jgi:hypothetical protein
VLSIIGSAKERKVAGKSEDFGDTRQLGFSSLVTERERHNHPISN